MHTAVIISSLLLAVTATPLFAVRLENSIQILSDGTHRAQQTDGKILKFSIKNGQSATAKILWQLPTPNNDFLTGANSDVDTTVAELVHGKCYEVDKPVTSVIKTVVGTKHACLLRDNGDIMCWGDNSFCQLGPEIPPGIFTTKAVHVFRLQNFSMLEVFGTVTCASNAAGGICWGATHPIKTDCLDRAYNYILPENGNLMRLQYAVVIILNKIVVKSVVGGTMYVGRAAETEIVNDPSAACLISESMVGCSNIDGFYVGDVFPLLSKPYSETLSLDGPLLFGRPGCGYKLNFEGVEISPADASIIHEYETSRGCLRILSCGNAAPNNNLPNSIVKLVSGNSHVCLLDNAGDVYCRGSNSDCQFISTHHKSGTWSKIYMPFKALDVFAHGDVTCVLNHGSAFCTGCVSVGCICTHSVTFTQEKIDTIDITDSGVCIETACVGTRGLTTFTDPVCIIIPDALLCGMIGYAANVTMYAASKETVVFTSLDGLTCVSDNGLRSVLCI